MIFFETHKFPIVFTEKDNELVQKLTGDDPATIILNESGFYIGRCCFPRCNDFLKLLGNKD